MANMHLVTGHAGQGHVTAADHGSLNAVLFGTGNYVLNRGSKFAATVVTNNTIRIADGDIMMQGRHIRINEGSYVDLSIENGAQGMHRNDLIVVRYTKDSLTSVEECNLVVLKGTAVESNPSDPAHTEGDIINDHDLTVDMPLYRLPIVGLNVGTPVALFGEGVDIAEMKETLDNLTPEKIGAAKANHTHTPASIGAASKSTIVTATLAASSWSGSEAPYIYTLSVNGVTLTSNQEILLATSATQAQIKAAQSANILEGGQAVNTIVLYAWGKKPSVDIPIRIIKRGDA